MDGTAGLRNAETFEEWYSAFSDNLKEENVREGLVPATNGGILENEIKQGNEITQRYWITLD